MTNIHWRALPAVPSGTIPVILTLMYFNIMGRIYKLLNVVTGDEYIGSTRNSITRRYQQIMTAARKGKGRGLIYDNIRAWGEDCFDIFLLYECTEQDNLLQKEIEYINNINPSLNSNLKYF